MKQCPKCGAHVENNVRFCNACGGKFPEPAQTAQNPNSAYPPPKNQYNRPHVAPGAPYTQPPRDMPIPEQDPYDHTSEFTAKDISDNKVMSILIYLMGRWGIIIAILAAPSSPYVGFHVRQALKIEVTKILLIISAILLCWTIIVPIAAVVLLLALPIIKIILFFQICKGKAKEPAIIKHIKFLK